jgi:hypothetical protein
LNTVNAVRPIIKLCSKPPWTMLATIRDAQEPDPFGGWPEFGVTTCAIQRTDYRPSIVSVIRGTPWSIAWMKTVLLPFSLL